MIDIPFNYVPRDYQLAFLKEMETKKRGLIRWPRRGGKDKTSWCFMVKEAVRVPGNYFYVFPTAKLGRQVFWEGVDGNGFRMMDHLPEKDGEFQIITNKNSQEMLLKLYNNSTIRILGSDHDFDNLRGISVKGAIFSEFAYQDPGAYKVMAPAIREAKGWAIFESTPNGRNHMYHLENRVKNSKNWVVSVFQTLWPEKENYIDIISREDLEEIQIEEGYTQEDMEREYGVSYATGMKGAFFAEAIEKAREESRVGSFPYEDYKMVDTFWDLGVNDSTAVWFRQTDGRRIIWIDYFEAAGKDMKFYAKMLAEKGYNYRTHYLPHDAAQRNLHSSVTTAQILQGLLEQSNMSSDVITNKRIKVTDRINAVRSRFSRYYFNDGLDSVREGLEKLSLYHRRWDAKKQAFLKEPVHDKSSHAADSFGQEATAEEFGDDGFEDNMQEFRSCNIDFDVLE